MKAGVGRVAVLTVGVALAVGGCSSDTRDGDGSAGPAASASRSAAPRSTAPDRALVKWADRMCEATQLFETMKTDSAGEVKEITDPPEDALIAPEFIAVGYLQGASSSPDEVTQALANVRPSGIAAADRLHDSLAKEIGRIQPKVAELTGSSAFTSPAEDSVDRAERVGRLIESLKMPKPGLPTVAAKEPKLSAAYRAAPKCAPPEPLPGAADGTDAGACKDGACGILVTKQVDVVVGVWKLRVSLTKTKATVRNSGPKGGVGEVGLGAGGTGSFGEAGGGKVTVKAVAVNEDGAVLKFSTK
ncbi:hypothetical protein [Streptomyces sp. Wb2n-11]|uniref:hypothetical protein n=1 Tax=Streptomyces sp. Wb2n-11 TaxID=1030533 RepID=UPI000B12A0A7|nr:hypothetical protein [Streptomyces sp. Wb2n-11]